MKRVVTMIFTVCLVLCAVVRGFAANAGSRASFTRGDTIGARYVAFGGTGEAIADDVYAIYWNPAGLSRLSDVDVKSPDEIRKKAEKGDVSGVTEEDLLAFTDANRKFSMQFGLSAARLDVERNTMFGGAAMTFAHGVLGIGAYSIFSNGIEEYNESGDRTGSGNYSGSVGYVSYGLPMGPSAIGFSVKGLYERISDATYSGLSFDCGAQAELLPFIKIGFVAQDIGAGLFPMKGKNVKKEYDFASPTLRVSAAVSSRSSDISFGFGVVRHLEQDRFLFNAGVRYDPSETISLSIGFCDKNFGAGVGWKIWHCEAWYAFSYDRIGLGYNNSISLSVTY